MIRAMIKSRGNSLVLDFPRGIYDIYEKLQSIDILLSPKQILLTDQEGEKIQVKLYAENEIGNCLIQILNEENSVADVNTLADMVHNASEDIRAGLEQNLLHGQYHSIQEVADSIQQMTYDSGQVKLSFYCPLSGMVDEECGTLRYPVENGYLKDYQWAIEEAIEQNTAMNEHDMAEFFNKNKKIKENLVSAVWSIDSYQGKVFGKISCRLKEELTEAEDIVLRNWICEQNADGWGKWFEQQAIDTEDGSLFVSFWNDSKDYSIMTEDELDLYLENQHSQQMGGM